MAQIELVDPKEYPKLLTQYQSNMNFHHLYSILKYYEDGRLMDGEVKVTVYEALSNQPDKKYYCVVHEFLSESIRFMINTDSYDNGFLQDATLSMMQRLHPLLNKYSSFYSAYIRQDIRKILQIYFDANPTHPHYGLNVSLHCFYSNDEQCKKLLEKKIELPEGYEFVELCDNDARQMCEEQLAADSSDEKLIIYRMHNYPAVGVVHPASNKTKDRLISYEHSDGAGAITLLYCNKNHIGKGLASRVEEQVCQLNIKEGITPYKGVSLNRPRVLQMSVKSGIWTIITDHQQNNEVFYCTIWNRDPVECVVIYED